MQRRTGHDVEALADRRAALDGKAVPAEVVGERSEGARVEASIFGGPPPPGSSPRP